MGVTGSKAERSEALRLCKERKRFIKQAIDSRYDFAAAHVAYTRSLRNIGVSLRRFAEAEVLLETPSHSSYPSPAPSQIGGGGGGVSDSPLPNDSPLSPQPVSRLSYMRSSGTSAVTVSVKPSKNLLHNTSSYVDDGEFRSFSMPPPPPPPLPGSSWDYFDPIDEVESFRFVGHDGYHVNFDDMSVYKQVNEKDGNLDGYFTPESEKKVPSGNEIGRCEQLVDNEVRNVEKSQDESCSELGGTSIRKAASLGGASISKMALEQSVSKNDKPLAERDSIGEREDPSEFITHRAKDFLSSIRDIENRFFRASESGREVSRMLEANKIHVGFSGPKGNSHRSNVLGTFRLNCCRGKTALVSHEPAHVTKVITWKRSTSSRSSSSRNPLTTASKDESDDSGSDFIEEFCMIAGSHSSTLDRLYAWERKLYDEVKASESIRKEYDRKCSQLRHQFAKDLRTHVIDKTRAVVKDLHSRIRVALHAVDSISKRIEKMRDEELQPQLVELIQGLIRMWKAMLECHHAQYITISLAYHAKRSNVTNTLEDTKKQIVAQLQHEVECFGLSFADMVNSLTSYVEALNGWLHNRNLQQRERIRGRSALSPPRRVLTPPIFVLCREWTSGIQSLPSEELSSAIRAFLCDLNRSVEQETEQLLKKQKPEDAAENEEATENKGEEKNDDHNGSSSNLNSMQQNLGKVLDRLTKFSEVSLKMYEGIRQKNETARNAYSNYRPPRSSSL